MLLSELLLLKVEERRLKLLVGMRLSELLLLHHHRLLHQVLLLLLLLLYHNSLCVLPEGHLLLFVYELKELLSRHGEYLVESTEHEALEVLVGNAEDGRAVRLLVKLVAAVEHELVRLVVALPSK